VNVRLSNAGRLEVVLYGLLLVYVLNLLVQTLGFTDPRARVFPLFIGVPTALLLGVLFVQQFLPARLDRFLPSRSSHPDESAGGNLDWPFMLVFASFPFVAYLVGFAITVPLYTFALTSRACEDLRTGLTVAAVVTVAWWILFVELLNVPFYEGILF
jgi:hypothetical protein